MPKSVSVMLETNVPVTRRDGVMLYADVYRPGGARTLSSAVATEPIR